MKQSPYSSAVKKEEQVRAGKRAWIDRQTRQNDAGKIALEHEKQDFLDETKAELEPLMRKAIPLGDHTVFFGKRIFVGFPGFGEGRIAARRRQNQNCISSPILV